jgi:hypothetical protein
MGFKLLFVLGLVGACDTGKIDIVDTDEDSDLGGTDTPDTVPPDTDASETDPPDADDTDPDLTDVPVGEHPIAVVCTPTATSEPVAPATCGELGTGAPTLERSIASGRTSHAMPVVADMDGDGLPEVLINSTSGIVGSRGRLLVAHGQDGTTAFEIANANLAFGAPLAVGDLDGDGDLEIVGVRALSSGLPFPGIESNYVIVAWSHTGAELWASETFNQDDLDYATAPLLVDLDHDGAAEIVAGRVILHAAGATRGVGAEGRGSWGELPGLWGEGGVAAAADLNLDGVDEVVVGNALYGPDGQTLWSDGDDGMVAIANLDSDPEAERIVSSYDTVRAIDDDHSLLWGPVTISAGTNIAAPAAIGDLDGDGLPEIVVGGGDVVVALHHDGAELWTAPSVNASGAAGASLADLDGDGWLEVLYADEQNLWILNGLTGAARLQATEHSSATMMEYPVVADIDGDGEAEILVAQSGSGATHAVRVFGAPSDGTWAAAPDLWNQHAYARTHVEADGGIPRSALPFADHNTWHAAPADPPAPDLALMLAEVCTLACDDDNVVITVQVELENPLGVDAGLWLAVYADRGGTLTALGTRELPALTGLRSTPVTLSFRASEIAGVDGLEIVVDDDGTGGGAINECDEADNLLRVEGPFCR